MIISLMLRMLSAVIEPISYLECLISFCVCFGEIVKIRVCQTTHKQPLNVAAKSRKSVSSNTLSFFSTQYIWSEALTVSVETNVSA